MLLPWTSVLILLSMSYGLFVLIALRGVCGVISDRLVAWRTPRPARNSTATGTAHAPRHIALPAFTPAAHAEA